MSDPDDVTSVHDAIERLEWDERTEERKYAHGESQATKWRQVTRRTALTGGAAGVAAMVLQACGSSSSSSSHRARRRRAASVGGERSSAVSTAYHFTMVNHVTTNLFFTPTQNGAADACKLLGCSLHVDRLGDEQRLRDGQRDQQRGRRRRSDGIAVLADRPDGVQRARSQPRSSAGIPVVAYNADEPQRGAPGLHRPGPVRLRPADGRAHRRAAAHRRTDRAVHRHPGLGQHPAADRRRARTPSRATRTSSTTWSPPAPRCRPS